MSAGRSGTPALAPGPPPKLRIATGAGETAPRGSPAAGNPPAAGQLRPRGAGDVDAVVVQQDGSRGPAVPQIGGQLLPVGGSIPERGAPDRPRHVHYRDAPFGGRAPLRIVAVVATCTASIRRNAGLSAIAAGPVSLPSGVSGPDSGAMAAMLLADDEHVARPITAAGTARFVISPPGVNRALSERLTIASPTASRGVSAFLIIPWRAARLRSGLAPTMHEPRTSRTSQVTRVRPSGVLVTRAAWSG
jgi:hypothetical protein